MSRRLGNVVSTRASKCGSRCITDVPAKRCDELHVDLLPRLFGARAPPEQPAHTFKKRTVVSQEPFGVADNLARRRTALHPAWRYRPVSNVFNILIVTYVDAVVYFFQNERPIELISSVHLNMAPASR